MNQSEHDMTDLEMRIQNLSTHLTNMVDSKDFEELFQIIRRPGWTTPAEILLVNGVEVAKLLQTAK